LVPGLNAFSRACLIDVQIQADVHCH
jgi:hypothetical protein